MVTLSLSIFINASLERETRPDPVNYCMSRHAHACHWTTPVVSSDNMQTRGIDTCMSNDVRTYFQDTFLHTYLTYLHILFSSKV